LEISDNGKVASFVEKPVLDKWINIGYFYFSSRIMGKVRKHKHFLDFLHETIHENRLYSYKHRGVHITVNTIKELRDAESNITQLEERQGA